MYIFKIHTFLKKEKKGQGKGKKTMTRKKKKKDVAFATSPFFPQKRKLSI